MIVKRACIISSEPETMRYYAYALLTWLMVIFIAGSATSLCPDITAADLERVIADSIQAGDNRQPATVTVTRFRTVCRAQGQQRDRYRGVSAVVEYTCTGNAECPSGSVVEQFESGCGTGPAYAWTGVVGSTGRIRTENPLASFTTTARDDCAFCYNIELANTFPIVTDNVTHCVGKFITRKRYTLGSLIRPRAVTRL